MPEIGKRIKSRREELGITQEELAAIRVKLLLQKLKAELMTLFRAK